MTGPKMAIPEFVTDRLRVRPLRAGDAEDIFAYGQDEHVARAGLWELYKSFDECQEHVERLAADAQVMWWVLEHRDGKVVGRVQLSEWSRTHSRAELSYALSRPLWGQGLMSEAVAPVVEYGWRELELHRLSAVVRPDNLASVKILGRVGMEREGRLRHHQWLWGEWVDLDLYAAIRPR